MTSHLFSKLALAAAATVLLMTPVCASADTPGETLVKKIYQQAFKEKEPSFDNYVQKYGTKEFARIWKCGSDALSKDGMILFDTDPIFFWTQDSAVKPKSFEIKALPGDVVTVSVKTGDSSDSAVYIINCDEGKCEISDFIYSFGSAKYAIVEAYPECMPKN